ncbi:hypothetical protein MP228_002672 [Amoeboaphelidium protococcarum]|nr:hypothetical protein MP228_002672 [Amoeboaphelidium protococcarum]
MSSVTFENCPGWVVAPSNKDSKPTRGLIINSEWWGLNDQLKALGARFANESYDFGKESTKSDNADTGSGNSGGYLVVCPDLYRSKVVPYGKDDEANHAMQNLDFQKAVDELKLWSDYLREQGCERVAVTGTCMGGALSLALASKYPDAIDACVPFYGLPGAQYFPPANIKVPVLFIFGKEDTMKGFSDPESLEQFKKQLKCRHETAMFEGCGHAFMNEHRPEVYSKDNAPKAFKKALEFLNANL